MSERRWHFSIEHMCGTSGAAILLLLAVVVGGGAGFLNIPSMMIVFGTAFFMMFACFGGEYMRFLGASFALLFFRPSTPNRRYAEMAVYAARFMIAAGVTGTLIGFIQMLRNMSDPASIGAGMAVSLITVLYAVVAGEFWCMLAYKVFKEKGALEPEKPSGYPLGLAAGIALWTLLMFLVLVLTLATIGFEKDARVNRIDGYAVKEGEEQRWFMEMDEMKINVREGEDTFILFVSPVLEMTQPPCGLIRDYGPVLRDRFQANIRQSVTGQPIEMLEESETLKKVLLPKLNDTLAEITPSRVTDIYFEEYVVLPTDATISLLMDRYK